MSFGKQLRTLRKSKKITQDGLAKAIGKHVTQIRRYESDESEVPATTAFDIAKHLNISIEELILGEEYKKTPLDESLLNNFFKIMALPSNKKRSVLDIIEAYVNQNTK